MKNPQPQGRRTSPGIRSRFKKLLSETFLVNRGNVDASCPASSCCRGCCGGACGLCSFSCSPQAAKRTDAASRQADAGM